MTRVIVKILSGFFLVSFLTYSASGSGNTLSAAGATFPYPLYEAYFEEYQSISDLKVHYEAVGSSKGVKYLLERRVDFGATDYFLPDSVLKSYEKILHVPTCIGAATLTYNIPGNVDLYLTPELIAGIFLGEITNWNDTRIRKVNADINLPDLPITVIHRYDGSGTTYIFSDYLSKVSSRWLQTVGRGKTLPFPVGFGAQGNSGVAKLISRAEGAIGYVEATYAVKNGLPKAYVKNLSGKFILPTTETVSLAAEVDMPADTRISITNTKASNGYPISGYTWLIFFQEQDYNERNEYQAYSLAALLDWILHEGQSMNAELNYAPLPEAAIKNACAIVHSITYKGKTLLQTDFQHDELKHE